jgi:hypothetical protein
MTHPDTLTLPEFSQHINCKRSYAYQLRNEGRLVMEGKRVRVAESIAKIAATRDPSKAGVAEHHARLRGAPADTGHQAGAAPAPAAAPAATEPEAVDTAEPMGYDYQVAKAKREHWAAERERASYLKEAGELMDKGQVIAAFADAGATLRGKLEAWAAVLPPQLEGRDEAAMRATLAEQVEQLLGDVSGLFGRVAQGDAC